jgi:hypothetical protein
MKRILPLRYAQGQDDSVLLACFTYLRNATLVKWRWCL